MGSYPELAVFDSVEREPRERLIALVDALHLSGVAVGFGKACDGPFGSRDEIVEWIESLPESAWTWQTNERSVTVFAALYGPGYWELDARLHRGFARHEMTIGMNEWWRNAEAFQVAMLVNAIEALARHVRPSSVLHLPHGYLDGHPVPGFLYVADHDALYREVQRLAADTKGQLCAVPSMQWLYDASETFERMTPSMVAEALAACPDRVHVGEGHLLFHRDRRGCIVNLYALSFYRLLLAVARGESPPPVDLPRPTSDVPRHALRLRITGGSEHLHRELIEEHLRMEWDFFWPRLVEVDGGLLVDLGYMGFAQLEANHPDPELREVVLIELTEKLAKEPEITKVEVLRVENPTPCWTVSARSPRY